MVTLRKLGEGRVVDVVEGMRERGIRAESGGVWTTLERLRAVGMVRRDDGGKVWCLADGAYGALGEWCQRVKGTVALNEELEAVERAGDPLGMGV